MCHRTYVEVRGQLVGLDDLLPSCGTQGSNLGCQSWQQAPLPSETSCWPWKHFKHLTSDGWIIMERLYFTSWKMTQKKSSLNKSDLRRWHSPGQAAPWWSWEATTWMHLFQHPGKMNNRTMKAPLVCGRTRTKEMEGLSCIALGMFGAFSHSYFKHR